MKPINNWNDVEVMKNKPQLPSGGYVCKIMGAEVKTYGPVGNTFEKLKVSIDICEGEHANFYANDYRSQTTENKKWKGVISYFVPSDDGTEKDNKTKRILKSFLFAVEESNPGYHWDWDEKKLKNKTVGVLFRREEFVGKEGKNLWATKPFMTLPVSDIQEGKFKMPEDKHLTNFTGTTSSAAIAPQEQLSSLLDDDLPFGV